jgi:hypothetical protein
MTSQIVTSTLDEDFPVAGQDNDSQGFRDNFSVIKTGLETAASEISVLQETTAKLGSEENNDFLGGIISNVQLSNAYKFSTTVTVNEIIVEDADYFKVSKVNGEPIVIEWPENENENYIKVRLEITAVDGARTIAFSNGISGGTVKANFTNTVDPVAGIDLLQDEIGIFDCWIAGADTTMFVQHIETFE